MPDNKDLPERVSPLANYTREHIVDYPEVRLSERKALTAIQVLSFRKRHANAAAAIGKALKVECPTTTGVSTTDGKIQVSIDLLGGCAQYEAALTLHSQRLHRRIEIGIRKYDVR